MTPNQRIIFNAFATYGRSLYSLACGLFTSRWVLMALGQEDFGLFGVVGGLVAFVGLVNTLMGTAVGRFYAVSVGGGWKFGLENDVMAIEECQRWFSCAVIIHFLLSALLMLIGYPLGVVALENSWIAVPTHRIGEFLWVFRFACISCFVNMVVVPFTAMYTAKQYIAELTIYSFVTTTLNFVFYYYMVEHPGIWLTRYAAWMAFVNAMPKVIIAVRACYIFKECRIHVAYLWSFDRFKKLVSFAGWQAFGWVGGMLRSEGIAILLNRHIEFGPMRNSSMTVANQVVVQTETLAGAMVGALQPAIANAYGAKDFIRMRNLAFHACRFGTLFSLLFALPLATELPGILRLWLDDPPVYAAGFCWCILLAHVMDRSTVGHLLAVNASGRIAAFQVVIGVTVMTSLPLAWGLLRFGLGVYSVGGAIVASTAIASWGRVIFARIIVDFPMLLWLRRVFVPLGMLVMMAGAVGLIPRCFMEESFLRIIISSFASVITMGTMSWVFMLDSVERRYVIEKVRGIGTRIANG